MPARVQLVDSNYNAVGESVVSKTITYVAGTTGAIGDTTLFTVTGAVAVRFLAVCSVDLTGETAQISVGLHDQSGAFLSTTTATDIDSGYSFSGSAGNAAILVDKLFCGNGHDIVQTIGTAAISGGVLTYYCIWEPISSGATVAAA